MNYVSVVELELLSFFEVSPRISIQDPPWPYNEFSYQVALASYDVTFGIWPASKEVSFSISREGMDIYMFKARGVEDVRYHKDADVESLEIVISDKDKIWFRLRPTVLVAQDVAGWA